MTIALGLACVIVALNQPWLGIELVRDTRGDVPPRVLSTTGPAQSIPNGVRLVAVHIEGRRFDLRSDDLHPEPQLVFLEYPAYDGFFARQDTLAQLLQRNYLILELDDGSLRRIQPGERRPLTDLPFAFWLQLTAGLGCLMCGGGLLAFRPNDASVRWCVITGAGVMLAACTAAVFSTRELALPLHQFAVLSALNRLGTCVSVMGFLATIFSYPQALSRKPVGVALFILGLFVWLGESLQWLPTGPASSVLLVVVAFPVGMLLAAIQWRRSALDLRARAAMLWFLLSWLGGGGFFVFMVLAPALVGQDVADVAPYAFGALLVTQFGLSFGMARYRLFDVERWAFRVFLLVGGAFAILLIDVLIVSLLQPSPTLALTASLLIAGWLYFPARQWLSRHLFRRARPIDLTDMSMLLGSLVTSSQVVADRVLPDTLQKLFSPLHLEMHKDAGEITVSLVDDGLALRVPDLAGPGVWELRLAEQGQRLFTPRDAKLATAVQALVHRFVRHDEAISRNVEAERKRLAQDLHDDVGARLLTLLHRSSDDRAEEVRGALASLRETVYALNPIHQNFADALASVRAETADRCEAAHVLLDWNLQGDLPGHEPALAWQQDLVRILREAISNALRHARPMCLRVHLEYRSAELVVEVSNDGVETLPHEWQPGIGLRGMRARAQRMGGQLQIERLDDHICLLLKLPMTAASRSAEVFV